MEAATYLHLHVADPFVTEAKACEKAVNFAKDLGFLSVQVEGDSLTIIKKLKSAKVDRSILGAIVSNIQAQMCFFRTLTFHHVRREANGVAHALAKEGVQFAEDRCWVEEALVQVGRLG